MGAIDYTGSQTASQVYISRDVGSTWTKASAGGWVMGYAMSRDGVTQYVQNHFTGGYGVIYKSTNSGVSFSAIAGSGTTTAGSHGIYCAGNGSVVLRWTTGWPTKSIDGGSTFNSMGAGGGVPTGNGSASVSMSFDGNVMLIASSTSLWRTTNGGTSFATVESARTWTSTAMSTDGTKMIAAVGGSGTPGQIYTSTDTGSTWVARDSSRNWSHVAISDDGMYMAGCVDGGNIYVSYNGGVTWTAIPVTATSWRGLELSSNGSILVACNNVGTMYEYAISAP
jgi:hypothetical protein